MPHSLLPIEAKSSLEAVKRLSQRLNEIMNYAANCGLVKANPLTDIRAVFNMAALAPDELPEFMGAITNASNKAYYSLLNRVATSLKPQALDGMRLSGKKRYGCSGLMIPDTSFMVKSPP